MRNLRKSVDAENSDDGPSLDAVVRIKFLADPSARLFRVSVA